MQNEFEDKERWSKIEIAQGKKKKLRNRSGTYNSLGEIISVISSNKSNDRIYINMKKSKFIESLYGLNMLFSQT